jgi:uncharacterized protein YjbI with pentapeptide repeats
LPPKPPEDVSIEATAIDGGGLVEARLAGVELDSARLARTSLRDVLVEDGSWSNLDAREASLRRVEFRRVRMTGAAFPDAKLEDVRFVDCRLDLTSFRFARLERVAFEGCRLEEADFYEATLVSAAFSHCDLRGASVDGARFERAELRGCELEGLRGGERLRGVRMPWPDVVGSAGTFATALGIEIVE